MTGRWYLNTAPWWILVLFLGTHAGATMWVLNTVSLRTTAVVGVSFGVVAGSIHALLSRRARSLFGPMTALEYRLARRASWRGPAPADPRIRELAHQMVSLYLSDALDRRGFDVFLSGTFLIGTSIAAFMSPVYYWLATAFFAFELSFALWSPLLFGRRIELLGSDADATETGCGSEETPSP